MTKRISERTVRLTISFARMFGCRAPAPEGVINPTLLKAADEMEQMLEELLELRKKNEIRSH